MRIEHNVAAPKRPECGCGWGLVRAALSNLRNLGTGRRPQGASTITQQVAKNFFLSPEQSIERKIDAKRGMIERYKDWVDGALRAGGKVTGILPYFLQQKEIAHEGLTDLILVESMHERKLKMHELSNGVIALPGGFGTMEELFEMLTWAQLGLHTKPIALLNTGGFYDSLGALMQTMTEKAFLKRTHHDMVIISDHIEELLSKMEAYIAPPSPKWITPRTT